MLSFTEDGYILDKFEQEVRWIAKLSDGRRVFQDDDRPGLEEISAWLRLKAYIDNNELNIDNITLQFRSHMVSVNNEPVDGFFFRKAALGVWGSDRSFNLYNFGTLKNNKLYVTKWYVPELEVYGTEEREIEPHLDSIIYNKYGR